MLTDMVLLETLERLQNRFASLAQTTIAIYHTDGAAITKPTWGSRFSGMIGGSAKGQPEWEQSVAKLLGSKAKTPRISCLEGMNLYATPIVHDGTSLATIVSATRLPIPPPPDEIRRIATEYDIDAEKLIATVASLDGYSGGSPKAIHRFAEALAETLAMLYRQATRIKRQFADLKIVYDLGDRLSSTQDLAEILQRTVRRVVEVMNVKACGIRLLDEETGELRIKAVHNLSEEYLNKGPVLLHENEIDSQAFAGQTVYIADAANDARIRYPQNAIKEGLVSGLCVPVTYRGETIGVLRVYTAMRHKFSDSEESLLRLIGSQAASAVVNTRLFEDQVQTDRIQRQVKAAAEIQGRMLPARCPDHPGLSFGAIYDPTLLVGGDFYDFIPFPDGSIGLCIADVVGKGLPAALLMASIRATLRAHATQTQDISTVLREVNRQMCRDTLISEFATLVYGVFSADGRSFRYSNAGHLTPLLFRDEQCIRLEAGGTVIGILDDAEFDQQTVALRDKDLLVMTTDGVTEALSFEDKAYGEDRLIRSTRKHRELDAAQLAQQILWDVRRFAGLAEQTDDITVVVAQVR